VRPTGKPGSFGDIVGEMKIRITSAVGAAYEVLKAPGEWYVVSIREPRDTVAPVDAVKDITRGILPVYFDDIDSELHPYVLASEEDVEKVIAWCRGKDRVLVHCAAGISRSSAMAYVIACSRCGGPSLALRILDPLLHWPNEHIVRLGAKLLGKPEMVTSIEKWKKESTSIGRM
jgi:predicted protein tyrosine phosphatase